MAGAGRSACKRTSLPTHAARGTFVPEVPLLLCRMKPVPDDLRVRLQGVRICRANGISPRVLVPEAALEWMEGAEERGVRVDPDDGLRERAVAFGRRHIGTPYAVHASIRMAPNAFSCSAFVKYVFAEVGIWMPRYAVDQSYRGRLLDGADWRIGNLAFWKSQFPIRDEDRAIGHAGIVCDDGRVLHAGGRAKTVHEFTSLRPDRARFVDPFPTEPHALVLLPQEERGLETALDLVRWMQR